MTRRLRNDYKWQSSLIRAGTTADVLAPYAPPPPVPLPAGYETTVTETAELFNGSGGYRGAVLMLDGRVFCVPANAHDAVIYNPGTDTVESIPFPANLPYAYSGGSLLPDGRVFCAPAKAKHAAWYDPSAHTVTQSVFTFAGGRQAIYERSVTLTDGRVFLNPWFDLQAAVVDATLSRIVKPSYTAVAHGSYTAPVLLADGRVFCVGYSIGHHAIYDPATGVMAETPAGSAVSTEQPSGGVLMADGRVFCVPGLSSATPITTSHGSIYNPATNSTTQPSCTFEAAGAYSGGVLLPDNRVFCVPSKATKAAVYDPAADTVTLSAATFPGGQAYAGGVLLPDGRVFCVPYYSKKAAIVGVALPTPLPGSRTLSPYYNKF